MSMNSIVADNKKVSTIKEVLKPQFEFGSLSPTDFIDESKVHENNSNENIGIFKVKNLNKWIEDAKNLPNPKMLFSEFWHEGEVCILFADTNIGKSILSVQIGNSLSNGEPIRGFANETGRQKVLYFDFELSAKQFEVRYSQKTIEGHLSNHYSFDDNFQRVEINSDAEIPSGSFEESINESIEQSIIKTESKVLIVDNITYLRSATETAKDALPLMKHLKNLQRKYGLSILILAHTPKRDLSKPITRNDLQGSKMLINFVDSCFTIGESFQDKNTRYIKQIKARNTEVVYDSENVIICQINKDSNFLQFEFLDFGNERDHLKELTEKDKEDTISKVKELIQQGMSQRKISAALGISLGAVNKYSKK